MKKAEAIQRELEMRRRSNLQQELVNSVRSAIPLHVSDKDEAASLLSSLDEEANRFEFRHIGTALKNEGNFGFVIKYESAKAALDDWYRAQTDKGIRFRLSGEPWSLRLTSEFIKSIDAIDRKLQGRILEALSEIVQQPCQVRGDTMKPLHGDLAGMWRYRLGDYRLIYFPNQHERSVKLLHLSSRADAYAA